MYEITADMREDGSAARSREGKKAFTKKTRLSGRQEPNVQIQKTGRIWGMSVSVNVTKGMFYNDAGGMISGNISASRAEKFEKKVKKQLNYNYKEISGQLLRANKSQSAAAVLVRAKSRLSVLQRSAATGQYDQRQAESAIAHARGMVRCAQMKVRNLKSEEQEQKQRKQEGQINHLQKKKLAAARAAQKENKILEAAKMESWKKNRLEKRKNRNKAERQRIHRNQERAKINETDARYLSERDRNSNCYDAGSRQSDTGVFLDLSLAAAMMNEEPLLSLEQQELETMDAADAGQTYIAGTEGMAPPAGSMGFTDCFSGKSSVPAAGMIDLSI